MSATDCHRQLMSNNENREKKKTRKQKEREEEWEMKKKTTTLSIRRWGWNGKEGQARHNYLMALWPRPSLSFRFNTTYYCAIKHTQLHPFAFRECVAKQTLQFDAEC